MGNEILSIFLLIPIIVGIIDLVKILKNKNRLKHIILLVIALCSIGYLALSSYLGGFNPMQGIVIGSFLYTPSYLILYVSLTVYLNKLSTDINKPK